MGQRSRILMRAASSFIITVILFSILSTVAWSDTEHLKGPAFSDPASVQEMPDEWYGKKIQYKPEMAGMDIVVDINQQIYPYLRPVIERYAKEKKIKIGFSEATCGKSAGLLERKQVDIGGLCCPPAEMDRLPGLNFHTLGIMPLSILVHSSNKIDNLSLDQVRKIFQGEIFNWTDVGGSNQPIRVIASMHCKVRPGHWRLLLNDENMFSLEMTQAGDMADTVALIANEPASIGYEVMLVAERFKHRGEVKALKIDGYESTSAQPLLKGLYPLYRTFNITSWSADHLANDHAEDLLKFLLNNVDKELEDLNLVPASALRKEGWLFMGHELVGEPVK